MTVHPLLLRFRAVRVGRVRANSDAGGSAVCVITETAGTSALRTFGAFVHRTTDPTRS